MPKVHSYQIIETVLGSALKRGMLYHSALPAELQRWYAYTLDGGHSILSILEQDRSVVENSPLEALKSLIPLPVRTIRRLGHEIIGGYVVVKGVVYDGFVGAHIPEGDFEFGGERPVHQDDTIPLFVQNGQEFPSTISATNYFTLIPALHGLVFLSWNRQTARLLLPEARLPRFLGDIGNPNYVVISYDGRSYDIMFEDGTDSPYGLFISADASDRRIPASDHGRTDLMFIAYGPGPIEVLRLPLRFRRVEVCPNRTPWATA